MKTIAADEARVHFDELLRDAEGGETVIVTRHGVPVAHIVPVAKSFEDAAAAIDDWRRYRHEHNITLGDEVTIRELIEEGRE